MPSWRGIGIGCESFKKQPELSESGRSELIFQSPLTTYSVEKLEKNEGMFFCRKPKHSELRTALGM